MCICTSYIIHLHSGTRDISCGTRGYTLLYKRGYINNRLWCSGNCRCCCCCCYVVVCTPVPPLSPLLDNMSVRPPPVYCYDGDGGGVISSEAHTHTPTNARRHRWVIKAR